MTEAVAAIQSHGVRPSLFLEVVHYLKYMKIASANPDFTYIPTTNNSPFDGFIVNKVTET